MREEDGNVVMTICIIFVSNHQGLLTYICCSVGHIHLTRTPMGKSDRKQDYNFKYRKQKVKAISNCVQL